MPASFNRRLSCGRRSTRSRRCGGPLARTCRLGWMRMDDLVLPARCAWCASSSRMMCSSCKSRIPIVLGERLYSRWDYRRLLEMRLVPIVQPDVIHIGGILELKKIGAMAEAYGVGIAAHNAAGPIST